MARPWKLKVSTYSPFLVSLCRTRNTPWPIKPCCNTNCAAWIRDNVPWNHGYSCNFWSMYVSVPVSLTESDVWKIEENSCLSTRVYLVTMLHYICPKINTLMKNNYNLISSFDYMYVNAKLLSNVQAL